MENNLLTINCFATLFNITVKTLRFYEKIGIFLPVYVNEENGYRYYKYEQITVFSEILQFKNSGFSLAEIKKILSNQLGLEAKKVTLLQKREALNNIINRFERLTTKEFNGEVKIVSLPTIYTVDIAKVFPNISCTIETYLELTQLCIKNKISLSLPCRTLMRYDSGIFSLENYQATMSICVEKSYDPLVKTIPSAKYLSTFFRGNLIDLTKAYDCLFAYAKDNNIATKNFCYELYELSYYPTDFDNQYIIEILLPLQDN